MTTDHRIYGPFTRRAILRLAAVALPAAALAACGGGQASTATAPAGTSAAPSSTTGTSAAPTSAAAPGTPRASASAAAGTATASSSPVTVSSPSVASNAPVAFRVEEVATGLDTPWELAFAPDGRIFITERPGRLRVVENGQLRAEAVAPVPDVAEQGEGGLLGLALAPDFASSGNLYVYHTYRADGTKNRVVRYTLTDRAGARGLGGQRIILDNIPGASNHNGGRIGFGPDGKLYVCNGDASNTALSQDRASLAGKILRLEPDGAIPADNPFPGSPVYSYGHRNPQGLAWQPDTGQLYATEHGSSANDEVNRIVAGGNYGWPTVTGTQNQPEFVAPIMVSGANNTWAPSGATFVRANTFPQLRGSLLFAGLRSTTLWQLTMGGATPQLNPLLEDQYGRLRAIAEGPDGNLYVLTSSQDGRGSPTATDDRLLRLAPQR